MKVNVNDNELELMTGDITKLTTDVIVNAANGSLLGGGGVDGAIHRAAGEGLLKECKQIRQDELQGDDLPTGQVVMTKGYQLPSKYVIHTVGPVWGKDKDNEDKQLADCYRNSLELAQQYQLHSIAFPSISTGVYSFPIDKAAHIAMNTTFHFLERHSFGKVVMTLFSKEDYVEYKKILDSFIIND